MEVSVFIDGRLAKRIHGRRIAHFELATPARKTAYTVRIVARTDHGWETISVRRYRRCGKTRPRTHVRSAQSVP